jgi:hypothetical protein
MLTRQRYEIEIRLRDIRLQHSQFDVGNYHGLIPLNMGDGECDYTETRAVGDVAIEHARISAIAQAGRA